MKINLILLFSIAVLLSCSNEDSSSIDNSISFYQNLKVEYEFDQQKTAVFANFNKQGALGENITLTGNSSVEFNNKEPNYSSLGLFFYTETFSGLKNVTFKFARQKNEVYINSASIEDVSPIEIPNSLVSIGITEGAVIQWIGSQIGPNESIQVRIVTNTGESNFYSNEVGSSSITIQLPKSISPGKVQLYLSRIKEMDLQESNGGAGGQMNIAYVRNKEITLEQN